MTPPAAATTATSSVEMTWKYVRWMMMIAATSSTMAATMT